MLAELSSAQERLLDEVEREWLLRLTNPARVRAETLRDGLRWLCQMARREPERAVVVDGPLEAQLAAMNSRSRTCISMEQALERRLLKEVWQPALQEIGSAVTCEVINLVGVRLSLTFHALREQLERALGGHLLNTRLGGGVAIDAYTAAFLDFFSRLGVLRRPVWLEWRDVLCRGLWCTMVHGGLAAAVAAPTTVQIQNLSLHSTTGPALSWSDGTRSYFLRGTAVCGLLFEEPEKASLRAVFDGFDLELKQDLITVLGLARCLSQRRVRILDEDHDRAGMPRRLLQLDVGWGQRWCVVEVRCPSKGDVHYLWVPPEMQRCSQAVAWTFGFEAENYLPLIEA